MTGATTPDDTMVDVGLLRSDGVGITAARGGMLRALGYGFNSIVTAAASVLLLRHLGVSDFGRFVTIASIMQIVVSVTDAGLVTVGVRDLALRRHRADQESLLGNLLGLRLLLTPIGVLAAFVFALVSYDRAMALGTLLAGAGFILITAQSTLVLPLTAGLRIGRVVLVEAGKQTVMLVALVVLVVADASFVWFFGVYVPMGVVALLVTPMLGGRAIVWRPAFAAEEWRLLVRAALPLAALVVLNVTYFRILLVMTSLISSERDTGLYGTSFRVFELIFGLSGAAGSVVLPVLSLAADDLPRVRYIVQRMTELSLVGIALVLVIALPLAEWVLAVVGGDDFRDAAPVLRLLLVALVPVVLGQVWQVTLIALRRQAALTAVNGAALLVVCVAGALLIPRHGARGAGVAALIAECVLACLLLGVLIRVSPGLRPRLGAVLARLAVPVACGSAVYAVPGIPDPGRAAIAGAVFLLLSVGLGLLPREVIDAVPRRSRRGGAR